MGNLKYIDEWVTVRSKKLGNKTKSFFVGRRTPEISSGEGVEPIWKASIQKRTANR